MLLVGLMLGLVIAARGEEATDAEPRTLEESLQKRRCVPTAVTRGPCHVCVCTDRGAYHCHAQECDFDERDANTQPSQPECEPNMLYNEGALWCSCDPHGFWKSSNCRANFRYVRHKQTARNGIDVPSNIACENGSLYVMDCNVCECRGSVLGAGACTNRSCVRGAKADRCKLGQLLRLDDQLCACSDIGYYVDKLCVNLPSSARIQKIASSDVMSLTGEEGAPAPLPPGQCTPHSVVQRDCNRCTCSASGQLVCTAMLCLPDPMQNVSRAVEKVLRSSRTSKLSSLPELGSESAACEPGRQYRFRCNTCTCSRKGVPACTTMICLDYSNTKPSERGTKFNKKVLKLPIIHEGDDCTPGKTYRLDCNVCRCSSKHRLICTKKLCLSPADMKAQLNFQHKMINLTKNKWSKKDIFMEILNNKLLIHQRINKDSKAKADKNHEKNSTVQNNPNNEKAKKIMRTEKKSETKSGNTKSKSPFPALPKNKCKPGQIYMKGCQRCFCNYKKIAQCTNRPCEEMQGPVLVPKDVYPRIAPKELDSLPTLPHEAARCKPGKVYMVECNVCLCLANGNLLCNTQLCLAIGEVNKLAAIKQNGQRCKIENGETVPAVEADCIECSCVQGKFECSPMEQCTPYRVRRALHGELSPRVKPRLSLEPGGGAECTPGMVYKQNCNNCYCQEDATLRCTRKGCLNFQQVQKLKQQRQRLLKLGL